MSKKKLYYFAFIAGFAAFTACNSSPNVKKTTKDKIISKTTKVISAAEGDAQKAWSGTKKVADSAANGVATEAKKVGKGVSKGAKAVGKTASKGFKAVKKIVK